MRTEPQTPPPAEAARRIRAEERTQEEGDEEEQEQDIGGQFAKFVKASPEVSRLWSCGWGIGSIDRSMWMWPAP